jgi:hypothetical protein
MPRCSPASHSPFGHLGDEFGFLGGGEPQARVQALAHRGVAGGPAEDERDGGQQPGRVEPLDDQGAARWPGTDRPPAAADRPARCLAPRLFLPP